MHINHTFIQSTLPELISLGILFPQDAHFCVDSRLINKGDVFIALPGNKVDGHTFIKDAISQGAAGIIVADSHKHIINTLTAVEKKNLFIGLVTDPYQALLQLAEAWRDKISCPIVGITGSIGKTSTREMLVDIIKLSGMHYKASIGNNNTALSVSQTILDIREDHQVVVLEMGVSKRGEMLRMAQIVKPTTAVITTIGHSHSEGIGSIHDIAIEKRALFSQFKADNIGIVNGDIPLLASTSYHHPILKFGCKTTNQIQARKIQTHGFNTSFLLKLYQEKHMVTLTSNHSGRVTNALAAAAAACQLGIKSSVIVQALQESVSVSSRFKQVENTKFQGTIIDDAYNASPESMRAALLAFEKIESKGQKIAVLGDMLELGVKSPFWHRQLGRFLRKTPSLTHLLLVGEQVAWTKKTAPAGLIIEHVLHWEKALDYLKTNISDQESTVLVKGSYGTHLHKLVTELTNTASL